MNRTLLTVLITIAAVHVANFLVLWADEAFFNWKYEDRTKQFCCLFAYLALLVILSPVLIYRKIQRRHQNDPVYWLYREISGDEWKEIATDEEYMGKFKFYPDAYVKMMEDVDKLEDMYSVDLPLCRYDRKGTYGYGDEDHKVTYRIEKCWRKR